VFPHRRGREGYDKYRHDFSKLIWQLASAKWDFDDATFDRIAASFDNPDQVAIVIHNCRWRLGLPEGERKYDDLEKRLAEAPVIAVPIPFKVTPTARRIRIAANSRAHIRTGSSTAARSSTRLWPMRSSQSASGSRAARR
jgi:hypothetical protein